MYKWLKRKLGRTNLKDNPNSRQASRQAIERYLANPNNPYLVSFPRTGSHWLRMLMELYFHRPTLVRSFYHHDTDDYLLYHTHDLELREKADRVIYLYREPAPTIYSQMQYHGEDFHDRERIVYWSELYGRHLMKWLVEEHFTIQKIMVAYEGMKRDLPREFSKICDFFRAEFDVQRLKEISRVVTKEEVKKKTQHDRQVINPSETYQVLRSDFEEQYSAIIWDILFRNREPLFQYFPSYTTQ